MNNNGMIEYKDDILTKIKKFIFNLFKKEKKELEMHSFEKNESIIKQKSFLEEIRISPTEEEMKLLNLQKDLENNFIYEEFIPETEKKKIIELYKKQNQELREILQRKRIENKLLIKSLKNT